MKPHWYKLTIFYCPICGRERKYRERIYGNKPTDASKRTIINEAYDYCDAFYSNI